MVVLKTSNLKVIISYKRQLGIVSSIVGNYSAKPIERKTNRQADEVRLASFTHIDIKWKKVAKLRGKKFDQYNTKTGFPFKYIYKGT